MTRTHAITLSALLALGVSACGKTGNAPVQSEADAPKPFAAAPSAQQPPAPQASSDENVQANVRSALAAVPGVNAEQISVTVSQGVVTLVGPVDGAEQKKQIVQLVSSIDGVRSVVDDLQPIKGS